MPVVETHRISNTEIEVGVWMKDGPGGFEIPES
jgi:hypothetical protein